MKHEIGYNSQRDNYSFFNTFPGWAQCFSTSAWMLMSYFTAKITAGDDAGLAQYVDDVEANVGKPGIGEIIKRKYNWISGNTSYWWLVQEAAITKWLNERGLIGHAKFINGGTYADISIALINGPVILQTNKLGGLPGGHIILLVGMENENFIVNDPYGNANTKYVDKNGHQVLYSKTLIASVSGYAPLYISFKS
jgi:uncharacterized protein YvpB